MVAYYEADPTAEGSDDEKRIKAAEKQALAQAAKSTAVKNARLQVSFSRLFTPCIYRTVLQRPRNPLDPFSLIHSRATNTAQVFQLAPLVHSGDLT